jgi:hypothetical protein
VERATLARAAIMLFAAPVMARTVVIIDAKGDVADITIT